MISVYYPRLRLRGKVAELPKEGLVLVHWDTGGKTHIPAANLIVEDTQ